MFLNALFEQPLAFFAVVFALVIALTVHEFYTEDDVADMAAAIHKVAEAAQKP